MEKYIFSGNDKSKGREIIKADNFSSVEYHEYEHDNYGFTHVSITELKPNHHGNRSHHEHGSLDVGRTPLQQQQQQQQHNQASVTNGTEIHIHQGCEFHLTYEFDDGNVGAGRDDADAPRVCSTTPRDESGNSWKSDKQGIWKFVCSRDVDSEGIVSKKVSYRPAGYFSDDTNNVTRRSYFVTEINKFFHEVLSIKVKHLYSDDFYDTLSDVDGKRGHLTIINMEHFSKDYSAWECETREGTVVDERRLIRLFLDLGFTVDVYYNPSTDDIKQMAKDTSTNSFSETSMTVCAVMSHGYSKKIRTKDGEIGLDEIISSFRQNETLAGKPKMFIIQSCRGDNYMGRIRDEVDGGGDSQTLFLLPCEADFLFAYSTVDGYTSWLGEGGSWFIKALVDVFSKNTRKMDVVRMLGKVNKIVGQRKPNTGDPVLDRKTQMPCIVSQLRRDLFLPHRR